MQHEYGARFVFLELAVAFSSLARILWEGSTIHSPPTLFIIF